MKSIPLHKLENWAANDLVVRHTTYEGSKEALESLEVHRDDSYFFLLAEKGSGSMIVDFNPVQVKAKDIYFLAPGQIHYNIKVKGDAWYIGVMPSLIPKEYLEIFERLLLQQQPYALDKQSFIQCQQITNLLSEQYNNNKEDVFYKQLTYTLLNSFLCIVARAYSSITTSVTSTSRPFQITSEFRKLLAQKFKSEKSPSYYARHLNISEIYLNETVKKITGFNVTYWIMYEIMLEAKRLLCHSQMNVKEIAHFLGYEDHTYFSRAFKKVTKTSPLAFRSIYLK